MSYLDRSLEERHKSETLKRRHVLSNEERERGLRNIGKKKYGSEESESDRLEDERIEMEERSLERLIEGYQDIPQLLPIESKSPEEPKIKKKKSLFDF